MSNFKRFFGFFLASTFMSISYAGTRIANTGDRSLSKGITLLDNANPSFDGDSRFASLSQWFEQGEIVTVNEVQGWHSGRCYGIEAPNNSTNIMSALVSQKTANDEGPAFPSPSKNYILNIVHYDEERKALPSNFFDNYNGEVDPENIEAILNQSLLSGKFSPIKNDDFISPIEWTLDIENNGRIDILYKIKKYNEYFMVEGSNLIKNNSLFSEALGKVIKFDVGPIFYCYFFKKIKN